jgi:hypothetical protein
MKHLFVLRIESGTFVGTDHLCVLSGWSGVRVPVEARFIFPPKFSDRLWSALVSCSVATGVLSRAKVVGT